MPNTSGPERVERSDGRAHLGAGQHAAGEFDGDLHLQRNGPSRGGHGLAAAVHRGLRAEQIEHRLDDEQVDAALEQRRGLGLVGVAELGVGDLAEAREPGTGTDRAGHEPGPVGVVAASHLAGDAAPLRG